MSHLLQISDQGSTDKRRRMFLYRGEVEKEGSLTELPTITWVCYFDYYSSQFKCLLFKLRLEQIDKKTVCQYISKVPELASFKSAWIHELNQSVAQELQSEISRLLHNPGRRDDVLRVARV